MQWSESMRNCRYHDSKAPKVDGIDIIHDSTSWCIKAPVQRVKMSTQPVKLNSFYKTLYWNLHCEETMGLLSICSPAFWAPFFWSAKPLTFSPFALTTGCCSLLTKSQILKKGHNRSIKLKIMKLTSLTCNFRWFIHKQQQLYQYFPLRVVFWKGKQSWGLKLWVRVRFCTELFMSVSPSFWWRHRNDYSNAYFTACFEIMV